MSREEWAYAYRESWKRYYDYEHCQKVMRRAAALRSFANVLITLTWFKASMELENVHPVESGLMRLKFRRDRRPTMPFERIWSFYPRYFLELARKTTGWARIYLKLRLMYLRIKHDPRRYEYTDAAITPVTEDETETHEMFQNATARAYVDQEQRLEKIRHGAAAA